MSYAPFVRPSFTPYESFAPDSFSSYICEPRRRSDSPEALTRSSNEMNKRGLGKQRLSGSFVPPPPLKGLDHVTIERTSLTDYLERKAGLSTSHKVSCDTTTKPKVVTQDSWNSTTHCAAATDVKASERAQDPRRRRSQKERVSSPFASPWTQETSTHNRDGLKICEGYKKLDKVKTDDSAKTGSMTTSSSRLDYLTLSPTADHDVSDDRLVNVFVGASRKVFPVHRRLLCRHSEILRLRFQDTQPRSEPEEYVLPTTEEKVFDSVINWLYRGNLFYDPVGIGRLYLLYYLAEELRISLLRNLVMDAIRERYRRNPIGGPSYPGIERIHEVYRSTTVDSPLRRFVVHAACWSVIKDVRDVEHYIAGPDTSEEFVSDFKKARQEKEFDPRVCTPCTFHIHEDGSNCGTGKAAKT